MAGTWWRKSEYQRIPMTFHKTHWQTLWHKIVIKYTPILTLLLIYKSFITISVILQAVVLPVVTPTCIYVPAHILSNHQSCITLCSVICNWQAEIHISVNLFQSNLILIRNKLKPPLFFMLDILGKVINIYRHFLANFQLYWDYQT